MRYRYLIAGSSGMFAAALVDECRRRGASFEAPPREKFDITDPAQVRTVMADFRERGNVLRFAVDPTTGELLEDVLVNAAAYTDVDRAESERDAAFRVNEHGPRVLAEAAREVGMKLVHISTDFVFDGRKRGCYEECDDVGPLCVYGESKLAGEAAVREVDPEALIVRTAWLYGMPKGGFPGRILEVAAEKNPLRVVDDQVGSPTYTQDLARALLDLIETGASGLFHLAGAGSCSRYELAVRTLDFARMSVPVEPIKSSDFEAAAARPANSALCCDKAASLGVVMPDWKDGLSRFVDEWLSAKTSGAGSFR